MGIYLGTWKNSGVPLCLSNAVYGSYDGKGGINRRVTEVDSKNDIAVWGGNYNTRKTIYTHIDIKYIVSLQGKIKEEVDIIIMALLAAPVPYTVTPSAGPVRRRHVVASVAGSAPGPGEGIDLPKGYT